METKDLIEFDDQVHCLFITNEILATWVSKRNQTFPSDLINERRIWAGAINKYLMFLLYLLLPTFPQHTSTDKKAFYKSKPKDKLYIFCKMLETEMKELVHVSYTCNLMYCLAWQKRKLEEKRIRNCIKEQLKNYTENLSMLVCKDSLQTSFEQKNIHRTFGLM